MTFAGVAVTKKQVLGTLSLLRFYRAFLKSDCQRAPVPGQWGLFMEKAEAERRLHSLVNVAINRKAGIPDETRDERDEFMRLWRDSRRVREILTQRIRHYQFETAIARERFGHLLSRYDD